MQGLLSTWQQMIRKAESMTEADSPLLPAYLEIWRRQFETLESLADENAESGAAKVVAAFQASSSRDSGETDPTALWQAVSALGANRGVALFGEILDILQRHLELTAEEVDRSRQLLDRLGWQGLTGVAAGRQSVDWEAEAPLRPDVFNFALAATFQPFFHYLSHETKGVSRKESADEEGTAEACPFCGSPALLSVVRSSDRKRMLVCGLCGTQWPTLRATCPYCGENDPENYHFLYAEEQPAYRVEICESCGRHLRDVDEKRLGRKVYALLEDVLTLPLEEQVRQGEERARH